MIYTSSEFQPAPIQCTVLVSLGWRQAAGVGQAGLGRVETGRVEWLEAESRPRLKLTGTKPRGQAAEGARVPPAGHHELMELTWAGVVRPSAEKQSEEPPSVPRAGRNPTAPQKK